MKDDSSFESILISSLRQSLSFPIGCYGITTSSERLDDERSRSDLKAVIVTEKFMIEDSLHDDRNSDSESPSITIDKDDKVLDTDSDMSRFNPDEAIDAIMNDCREIFVQKLKSITSSHEHKEIDLNAVVYVAWIATLSNERGKGLAESLLSQVDSAIFEHNRQIDVKKDEEETKRFQYSVAFCSSPISTHIFSKAGYCKWHEFKYSQYKLKGTEIVPFESLSDGLSVMVKEFM